MAQVEANIPKTENTDSVCGILTINKSRTNTGYGLTPKWLVIIMAALQEYCGKCLKS